MESRVGVHLFGISANSNGSIFLGAALAAQPGDLDPGPGRPEILGDVGPNLL